VESALQVKELSYKAEDCTAGIDVIMQAENPAPEIDRVCVVFESESG